MIEEEILYQKMCDWRHYLHQYPEVSYEEYKTSEWLQEKIREFGGFDIIKIGETSFIATIYGKKEGSKDVIAFRTDIDALPVKEETDLPYASLSEGVMHACGHDFHMSMLLGLASWLSDNQDQFSNAIKLVFQSAEEVPPGGAKEIVASGILDDVSHIYGFHVFPGHQVGYVGIASGPITASQDIIELEIRGKGSHGATPELGVDPILVGAEIISSIHHIVSRNISAFDSAVISFGEFHAGDIFNIIPDKAVIRGNVRTINKQVRQLIEERITQVIEGVCLANNATFKLNYTKGYGPVINDEFTTQIAYDTVKENLDEKYIFTNPQKMVSEDFSEYGKKIPSCFMILGGGLAEDGYEYMNHHPKFYLDESLMKNGVFTYINLVKKHSQL